MKLATGAAYSARLEIGRLDATVPGLLAQFSMTFVNCTKASPILLLRNGGPFTFPLSSALRWRPQAPYPTREPEESGNKVEKVSAGSRLLDLNLSELGRNAARRFHARQGERAKSLELFLRSANHLDDSVSQDIRTLFTNAPGNDRNEGQSESSNRAPSIS